MAVGEPRLRRTWSRRGRPSPGSTWAATFGKLPKIVAATPADLTPVHGPIPVDAAVSHPVAQGAVHRLNGRAATIARMSRLLANDDRVKSGFITPAEQSGEFGATLYIQITVSAPLRHDHGNGATQSRRRGHRPPISLDRARRGSTESKRRRLSGEGETGWPAPAQLAMVHAGTYCYQQFAPRIHLARICVQQKPRYLKGKDVTHF
jgi:hypothetical protein